jgi:PAS domain S-box-containing protein
MVASVTAEELVRVIEQLTDGLMLFQREGCLLYLNAEAARILGRPASELVGKPLRETMPEVVSKMREGARDRLRAGEEVLLVQSFFGQGRWFEILGRPLGGRFLVHFHDITERLQAEAARHQLEERFQILLNGVSDYAIFLLDPKGDISSWNAAAERISGYPAEEVLGKPLSFLFPPDLLERGEPRRRLEETVTHGSYKAEARFFRRDGVPIVLESSHTALYDQLGAPSGFAIVTHDVTEQRKMEASLRSNQERLRLATEAGAVGTWEELLDEGRIVADNQFLALSELSPDQRASFEDVLSKVHPDDRDHVQNERKRALEMERGGEFQFEYRVGRRTNGNTRWVECHGKIFASRNEPEKKRVIGVLHDTTELHRFDEFRRLAAGIIAHDLRSPLSAIKLTSQMLIAHEGLPQRAIQKVQTIVRKVDTMVKMVERLLLYTQAQFGGGLSLDKEFVDLESVCRDALGDVQASRPDAEIHIKTEGNCCGVWDRIRLTEVVSNLVGNAAKHGQPGQPIHVLARDEGDQVSLHVHNLGPPIPTELLPVIFEPFRRRTDRPHGSSEVSFGLGLYIVKEIVAAHGGIVEVSSSAAGTTFIVRLPRGNGGDPSRRSTATSRAAPS